MSSRATSRPSLVRHIKKLDFENLKLYGREEEMTALRSQFQHLTVSLTSDSSDKDETQLVLVHGISGVGKSALIGNLGNYVRENRGFFGLGKQDQLTSESFSAINEALRQLSAMILEDPTQEARVRQLLNDDFDYQFASTIAEALPGLAALVTPPVRTGEEQGQSQKLSTNSDDQDFRSARLKCGLRSFLLAVSKPESPVVLAIDDLQWIDQSSLDLIVSLVTDHIQALMIVCTYRGIDISAGGNEDEVLDPLFRIAKEKYSDAVATIKLDDLQLTALNGIVAALTDSNPLDTASLSEVIMLKTNGNPFYALQFMESLHFKGMIHYDMNLYRWAWDLDRIKTETDLTENVAALVVDKLKKMTKSTLKGLMIASCIGSTFYENVVFGVLGVSAEDQNDLKPDFEAAAVAGLVISITTTGSPGAFRFTHDRIQFASYSMFTTAEDRERMHLRIGMFIKGQGHYSSDIGLHLVLTEQLNLGHAWITEPGDRVNLMNLNRRAAEIASQKSAFSQAVTFLREAIALIPTMSSISSAWRDNYDLTLDLHSDLAEKLHIIGSFRESVAVVESVLRHAKSVEDTHRVVVVKLKVLVAQEELDKAIDFGLRTLKTHGERIPKRPWSYRLIMEFLAVKKLFTKQGHDAFLNRAEMSDAGMSIVMMTLKLVGIAAWFTHNPELMTMTSLRAMKLSLIHGPSKFTAYNICVYGLCVSGSGDFDGGYKLGQLAEKMATRFNAKDCNTGTSTVLHQFLRHLRRPLHESLDLMLATYKEGMSVGDIQYSSQAATHYVMVYFQVGLPLPPVANDFESFSKQLKKYSQDNIRNVLILYGQTVFNFQGRSTDPLVLTGEAMDEDQFMKECKQKKAVNNSNCARFMKMILAYFFEEYELAVENAEPLWNRKKVNDSTHMYVSQYAFVSAMLAMAMEAKTGNKRKYRKIHVKFMKMVVDWEKKGVGHVSHMVLLLRAEREAVMNNLSSEAIRAGYDKAIAALSKLGTLQYCALAYERCGRYLQRTGGDQWWASHYLKKALEYYQEWGATAKVDHMIANDHLASIGSSQSLQLLSASFKKASSTSKGRERFSAEPGDQHNASVSDLQFSSELLAISETVLVR